MTIFSFNPGNSVLRGPDGYEDFRVSVQEIPTIFSGGSTTQSSYDANLNSYSSAGTLNTFALNVSDSPIAPGHTFVNNTPGVCSVDGSGNVSGVPGSFNGYANGPVSVTVQTKVGSRTFTRTFNSAGSNPVITFAAFKAGSLGLHVSNNMAALISGLTAGVAAQHIYSSNNLSTSSPAVTRNANAFVNTVVAAHQMDFSGLSVINQHTPTDAGGALLTPYTTIKHPVVMISKRHFFGASHYFPGIGQPNGGAGTPVVFKGSDGAYYPATILGYYSNLGNDYHIGYLDRDMPAAVRPFRTLPANALSSYLNSLVAGIAGQAAIPVLPAFSHTVHTATGVQDETLGFWDVGLISLGNPNTGTLSNLPWLPINTGNSIPNSSPYRAWSVGIQGGDSGGPTFLPIDPGTGIEPVLVMCFYGPGGNDWLCNNLAAVNNAMNSIAAAANAGGQTNPDATAGSYAVGTVPLTGFTQFLTP